MRHDVFVNPNLNTRIAFPFLADLQADVAEGRQRFVAPMVPASDLARATARVTPLASRDGRAYHLATPLMVLVPVARLRNPVGTIRMFRDEITRAFDWLFTGV